MLDGNQQRALNNRTYKLVDAARKLVEDFDSDQPVNQAVIALGDAYGAFVDYVEKVMPDDGDGND